MKKKQRKWQRNFMEILPEWMLIEEKDLVDEFEKRKRFNNISIIKPSYDYRSYDGFILGC